jgi:hypothetical protein
VSATGRPDGPWARSAYLGGPSPNDPAACGPLANGLADGGPSPNGPAGGGPSPNGPADVGPWAKDPPDGEDDRRAPRPRPGWFAYRVAATARVPPWVVEVALTIERPAHPAPALAGIQAGAAGQPIQPGHQRRRDPTWTADEPAWSQPGEVQAPVEGLLLLRARSRSRLLEGAAEVAREFEAAAGLRPAGSRLRFLSGPALPGLIPVTSAVALAHLALAGDRGLPAPLRRRQPVASMEASWRSGAGSVLTCDRAGGTSAQAVIALRGPGNPVAVAPPPGGALVVRAWRGRHAWGLACGLVLGAAESLGLGRAAGHAAAAARREGWDAAVLRGLAALQLARAGDPSQAPPQVIAHAASSRQLHAMLEACLAAGGFDHPRGPAWTLAVTP